MENLEKLTERNEASESNSHRGLKSKIIDSWHKWHPYRVDVASGWAYYTPVYAIQEAIAGKDLETIATTRGIGLAAHALAIRPIGKVRNYLANKWGVTKESPILDQIKVNLVAVTPIQSVVYAGMLGGGMSLSGNYDWNASLLAWGIGTGLGALHAIPYGYVQDFFRKKSGIKPAFKSKK